MCYSIISPVIRIALTLFLCMHTLNIFASNLPPGFAELLVAQDLDPTAMALAPDGRLFITEKNGTVLIVENGQLLPDPFLILEVDNYNERGLSGIAFDPHFAHNGHIYFYYTVAGENHNRVSRFTAEGNYAVPGSEYVLLDIDQLNGTIHNAGSMAFGPDEKLYISVGDGANGDAAQDMNSLLGKILRINADGSIPDDNPFFNQASGIYRSIYALGFRNSFSMTIQPLTGRIFATEVGASSWEEINEILPGRNYGWPLIEGPLGAQTPPDNYQEPVFFYNHNDGCAAVGAAFYNPDSPAFPSPYHGKFFFADYCHGYIRYMDPSVPGITYPFADDINRPLNLLVAPDGTMYYLARAGLGGGSEEDNTASNNGTLWRVFYSGSGKPFISVNPQSLLVSQGEDARFISAASGEAPLSYQWQRNGTDIPGAIESTYILPNTTLADSGHLFRLIVINANGSDTSSEALLRVTANQRPLPEIINPPAGLTYRGGDVIMFSGFAFDSELGQLGPAEMKWKIDFHHNEHTHPALIPTAGIDQGEYVIPQTGETSDQVWYRIHLTATDHAGLSKTITRDILPEKTQYHVHTIPEGLPVYIESEYLATPVSVTSVVGIIRRIEVLASVFAQDSIYIFRQWSDGYLETSRMFAAEPDTVTYTAIYDSYPLGKGTGIRGYYYDWLSGGPEFTEPFKFTWIDPEINFDWYDGSPAANQLGVDFWLVRWDGFVEPLFTGLHNFHVVADDGIRLWVDDQLIIDAWIPQPPTEWTGTIELEAGKQYPLRLEFFEEGGGAVCQLYWSNHRIAKSIVPQSQLYPEQTTSITDFKRKPLTLYPNPAKESLMINFHDRHDDVKKIWIINSLGQKMFSRDVVQPGADEIIIRSWPQGFYILYYELTDGTGGALQFIKQ